MRWTGLFFLLLLSIAASSALFGQEASFAEIKVEDNYVEIHLKGSSQVKINSFTLTGPDRIVVDLSHVRGVLQEMPGKGKIRKVRTSQFAPGVARVVLDLDSPSQYEIKEIKAKTGLIVRVQLASRLQEIQLFDADPLPTLLIKADGELEPNIFNLPSPERLVVDLANASLAELVLPEGLDPVVRVRASQFNPKTVRVVLDLTMPLGCAVERQPSQIQIKLRCRIEAFTWQQGKLRVQTRGPVPQLAVRREGKIWLEFPSTVGASLPRGPSGISLAWEQADSGYLAIDCPGKKVKITPSAGGIVLEFLPSALTGVTVVLDPGHGGADPGAIGPNGLREKDVNLAIAKAAAVFLETAGAKVLLTRQGDEYISLADRVAQCHTSGAKIFVSIHCNSFGDNSRQGTETFYAAQNYASKLLAEAIQNQILALRPTVDRGVKPGNFYVLRENTTVAVLTEVAFISNPEEETLLADPEYQQKVGRAVADGVEAFLEENQG